MEVQGNDCISGSDGRSAWNGSSSIHINEVGLESGVSPVASGSLLHTQVMKTEALRQALDKWQFDAAFGGRSTR